MANQQPVKFINVIPNVKIKVRYDNLYMDMSTHLSAQRYVCVC